MNITTRYPINGKCVEVGFDTGEYVEEVFFKGGELEGFIDQLEELVAELKRFKQSIAQHTMKPEMMKLSSGLYWIKIRGEWTIASYHESTKFFVRWGGVFRLHPSEIEVVGNRIEEPKEDEQ
jgi:hypothetical protein